MIQPSTGRKAKPEYNLKEFARALNPAWKLEDWFDWPPDLFALTSLFLKHTGAYRYSADPPAFPWPRNKQWTKAVNDAADQWLGCLWGKKKTLPNLIRANRKILEEHWQGVSLDRLNALDGSCREWELCRAILELHALADTACGSFGHPSGGGREGDLLIRYFANMLLATTGSLSRLPKHKVLVLPKMRTPRVGMTLRSLSLYVTAHESEVGVVWRSMPWVNIDENTINIMVVPWPYEMKSTWFKPDSPSIQRTNKAPFRYFKYTGCQGEFPTKRIVEMVKRAQVPRVHMIVFPELALAEQELDNLKWELANEIPVDCMPMLIAGVLKSSKAGEEKREKKSSARLDRNQVILSTYFAGRWYDLSQDKHHRWKLDGRQIERYKLGGSLPGEGDHWEAIQLAPRRLTFLAPNGWLALCPLICEDLARLEPVSELIRGVGPTLAVALLLDGPQLQRRWPGIYAGVLADDPGTSVLTVSSLGMVMRGALTPEEHAKRPVALWKDLQTGGREVGLPAGQDAVLFTIAARWTEEYTADGRGDKGNAGLFTYRNDNPIEMPAETRPEDVGNSSAKMLFGKPLDIEELTWFTFLVDAALGVGDSLVEALRCCALGEACDHPQIRKLRAAKGIWKLVSAAIQKSYQDQGSARQDFRVGVDWLAHVLTSVERKKGARVQNWTRVIDEVEAIFDSIRNGTYRTSLERDAKFQEFVARHELAVDEVPRIKIYASLSLLWAVHKRIVTGGRKLPLDNAEQQLLGRIEDLLRVDYRRELEPRKATGTPTEAHGGDGRGPGDLPRQKKRVNGAVSRPPSSRPSRPAVAADPRRRPAAPRPRRSPG